mmetsp:Transcript_19834/g.32593  ORF Transcript_19834/g.32593 Transcript_19834/m.32593 type:complete len:354 (+) Transcript_19834:1440-2501(+)
MRLVSVLCASLVVSGSSHQFYQLEIPNGHKVPGHPGVGHVSSGGAGPKNSFGNDFVAAGRKWTVELCEKDSDGGGASNGQELGDPDCTWVRGAQPSRTTDITHPGVEGDDPTQGGDEEDQGGDEEDQGGEENQGGEEENQGGGEENQGGEDKHDDHDHDLPKDVTAFFHRVVPKWVKGHAVGMIIGWGIFYPIALFAPMMFKHNPNSSGWFVVHRVCLVFTFIATIAAILLAVLDVGFHFHGAHAMIGFALVFFMILQTTGGILRAGKDSPNRRRWETIHRYQGRTLGLVASINIYLGLLLAEDYPEFKYGKKLLSPAQLGIAVLILSFVIIVSYFGVMFWVSKRKTKVGIEK